MILKKEFVSCELINWTFFSELDLLGFQCLIYKKLYESSKGVSKSGFILHVQFSFWINVVGLSL